MKPLRTAALAAALAVSLAGPGLADGKPNTGKPPQQDGVCTPDQRAMISTAFDQAEARVRQAIALLEAQPDHPHLRRWFGTTPAKVVHLHFDMIAERLATGRRPQIRCNDAEGCPANRRLFGYHPGRSDLIGLCRGFFEAGETGQDSRFGVIIHEISHLAVGTRDSGYQPRDAEALAKDDPAVAAMNADNYEYFVETLPAN